MEGNSQNSGVTRVLKKLESSLRNGNYYEAHQMYRTLYFRYLGQKKYSELLQLLYNGSITLSRHEQHTSGADLGILFIKVLQESDVEPSEIYFRKLIDIFCPINPASPERETFVHNAVRWSVKGTNYTAGHPDFHQKLAQVYWHEKNYSSAKQHFLLTNDGSGCASMLIELHQQQGYSNEIDLIITHTVLQYLCFENKATAEEAFKSYISKHPQIKHRPPFVLPLLNFSFFLLKTIDLKKRAIFIILCEQYVTILSKEPNFLQYLDKIGQIYFNLQSPRTSNRGWLGSFIQSFFNGLDDDNSAEQRNTSSTMQSTAELD